METIDDILDDKGFSPKEKETFLDILKQAKSLQTAMCLEQLKPYMDAQIDKMIDNNETAEY